ncbi:MAG: S9 family peptidase [Steroidobacteraceae bacterium]
MSHAQRSARMICSGLACAALAGVMLVAPPARGSQPQSTAGRVLTHEDLWLMPRVGGPRVSPDGRWVVVSVTEPAYDPTAQRSDLWLLPSDGSEPARRLTGTAGREADIAWSPDSRSIAFSARRDGDDASQIYLLSLAGGDAQRLTSLAGGVRAPEFSPDGRRLLMVGEMWPGARNDADQRRIDAERKARPWNARIYEGFPIRNWDRWLDDRQAHVFVLDLPRPGEAPAEPRSLLAGTRLLQQAGYAGRFADGGQALDAIWTPDGTGIVFVASTDRNTAAFSFTNSQVFRVAAEGGEPVALTSGQDQWSDPRFSPDGRWLVASVERRTEKVYNRSQLAALDAAKPAQPRWLTPATDLSVGRFAFGPDSRSIYFLAEDAGHEKLFRLDLRDGRVQPTVAMERGVYGNLSIAERSRGSPVIIATWESAQRPPEVVRIDPLRGTHRELTGFTAARLEGLDLPAVEPFWFTSQRGRRIHSLLVRPPGFDPNQRYPVFAVIHGGPHAMWRDQWVLRWNYHLLAARGHVLVLTNYTGSTGFGEAFAQAIQGDPLRTPAEEINEAVDVAIAKFPFIDGQRHCAGGASYGGHLSNWLQGTTTRYRCLVSHAGLVNLEAQWGTSDVAYPREVNNGGPVWEQGPVWREQNPIRLAGRFATPTLVTVGEQDFRVPLNNVLEYWTALQRQQVPSRLVVYPTENHWILGGENSRLFYREIHDWLDRWLGPATLPRAEAR